MTRRPVSYTIPQVVEAAARVIKVIRRIIEFPKSFTDDGHQAPPGLRVLAVSALHILPRGSLVTAQFPKHRTAQVLPYNPIGFPGHRILIVVGDHFLLVRVVRPRRECVLIMVNCRTRKRESTIVVGTPLPGALSDSVKGVARSIRVHERPTV